MKLVLNVKQRKGWTLAFGSETESVNFSYLISTRGFVCTIAMENRCSVLGCLNTSDDGVRLHEYNIFLLNDLIKIIETLLCIIL